MWNTYDRSAVASMGFPLQVWWVSPSFPWFPSSSLHELHASEGFRLCWTSGTIRKMGPVEEDLGTWLGTGSKGATWVALRLFALLKRICWISWPASFSRSSVVTIRLLKQGEKNRWVTKKSRHKKMKNLKFTNNELMEKENRICGYASLV
jgi:hypothetical protein